MQLIFKYVAEDSKPVACKSIVLEVWAVEVSDLHKSALLGKLKILFLLHMHYLSSYLRLFRFKKPYIMKFAVKYNTILTTSAFKKNCIDSISVWKI